jgi:phage N-6-adenine-methyltransferase
MMASLAQSQQERQDYETPPSFMEGVVVEFGAFDVDVAATVANSKAARCWTPEDDGLAQDWAGLRCWMNPPYGRGIGEWVGKAATGGAALVVALLPARTDTRWFHDHVYGKAEVRFLKGRIAFWLDGEPTGSPGKFPSMLAIWRAREKLADAAGVPGDV